jgi:hypothetical protein
VRGEFDAEQIAHLAIEVGEAGLGPAEDADLDVALSAASRSARMRSVTDLPVLGAPVTRAKPSSPMSCSTRQQNDSMRRLTWSAWTGTSGANGFHLRP